MKCVAFSERYSRNYMHFCKYGWPKTNLKDEISPTLISVIKSRERREVFYNRR